MVTDDKDIIDEIRKVQEIRDSFKDDIRYGLTKYEAIKIACEIRRNCLLKGIGQTVNRK